MTLEQSPMDKAVDVLLDRRNAAKEVMRAKFKRTRPFRQDPKNPDDELYHYEEMNRSPNRDDMMLKLVEINGVDAANAYIQDMEELKARRGLNG